jgi:hypothetical protein
LWSPRRGNQGIYHAGNPVTWRIGHAKRSQRARWCTQAENQRSLTASEKCRMKLNKVMYEGTKIKVSAQVTLTGIYRLSKVRLIHYGMS